MRKFLFFFLIFGFNLCFSQNYNWITPNKDYLKLYISDDGIYRINKIDFINAGVNPSSIDPRTVKVYYKGNQIPIYFNGENDGVFNDTDYFDFYGQRNYGGLTNTYKELGDSTVVDYITDEFYNLYSDTSAYWVGWDGAYGLRFAEFNYSSTIDFPQDYFFDKLHFEKDLVYSMGETVNPNSDFRYFNTEKVSGEGWYRAELERGNSITDTFRTPLISTIPQNCSLKLFAYPNAYSNTITNEHRLIVKINSVTIDTLYRTHYAKFDTTIYFSSSLLSATSLNQVTIIYTTPASYPDGRLYFDYFSINYPKVFSFENNQVSFNTGASDSASRRFKIKNFISNESNIYDLTNGLKITNFFNSSDTLFFTGKGNGNYSIVNKYITKKPLRMKRKQVPLLTSGSIGADYLIVYNKLFESQAEQLRAYRNSHDNFRSVKAEVEDIYDIFNFGMEDPVAIKNFVRHAYTNWPSPAVKFLCLFGRGSIDPKKIYGNSVYYQNLIPIYGNPPSDGYYATINANTFWYCPQISVGRLPVYTSQEAQDVVNKIINYENNPLDVWVKKFNFITGGFNIIEQTQFINNSNGFISTYVTSPPIAGYPIRIFRTDTSGQVSYNFEDSIKNTINKGNLIINYIGHAATSTWDNGIKDPNDLVNGTKNPLIFSMTCYTGKNAQTDPDGRGFGEKFVILPNKGAIGFIGTTGWSFFPYGGNNLNDYLLRSFSFDSLRRAGDILRSAETYLKNQDSRSFSSRNTINSYNLIGDPAAKLVMPSYPEFDIQMSDYRLSPVFPTLREVINLKIFPKNLGTRADSCKIRFELIKNNISNRIKDTVVKNFDFVDSLNYNFVIDSAGIYAVKVSLDVDNRYTREIETNNSILIPIPLKNISFVPLKPIDNSIVQGDSVTFVGINPNIDPKKTNVKLYIQFDTNANFNSPFSRTFYKICDSGVVTKFKVGILFPDTNTVYFWRTNSVINNTDTSGWTFANRFLYSPVISGERKLFKSNPDSNVAIYKKFASQYNITDLGNTMFTSEGIKLKTFTGDLYAQSWGGDPWDASFFRVNGYEIFLLDPVLHWGGLNIIKVRKNDGAYVEYKHFKFTDPTSSDSVINYLNTFNGNYILLVVKNVLNGVTDFIRPALVNKFHEFGSSKVDSVRLNTYDRWSFISYPSGTGYNVAENYLQAGTPDGPAISSMAPQFQFSSGYAFHNLGPTAYYRNFSWNQVLYPNSTLKFDIYGITKDNQNTLLYSDITSNNYFGLDSLKSYVYPNLLLKTKLSIDSINGNFSPVFKSLKFNYVPPAELISDNYSFVKSDSILQEGDSVRISVKYYNVGFVGAVTSVNTWSASSPSGMRILKVDTLNYYIPVDSSIRTSALINTAGLRNPQKTKDTVYIFFETKLKTTENEFFTYNNTAITSVLVTGDSTNPSLDVTYDGMKVQTGDFIQSKPVIVAKFLDDSKMQIRDTSNIRVYLDTQYVRYYNGGIKNPDIEIIFPFNKFLQATVVFKPTLADGPHDFMFVAYDKSNNYADTVRYMLAVNPEMKIYDLNTFPNPMKTQTNFIFNLSGSSIPNYCKLKIFTVAGRIVKTINFVSNIGYNQIPWDGRDDDGDYMANGVYLYKLIIEGNSKKETSTQKLVILK